MANKPVTWSYSALTAFETCPWRYYLTKVSKQVTEPQGPELAEGNAVHKAIELHIKGQQWLPDKYKKLLPVVERVKQSTGRISAERKFALTADYRETTYFGKDVWLRGVFDVEIVTDKEVTVIDWKNGKRKPDTDQLRLFAASAFKLYPYIQRVHTAYVWLKPRQMDRETFEKEDVPPIMADFATRVRRIEIAAAENDYPKRPSGLCREWCPVGKKLCEHCGK